MKPIELRQGDRGKAAGSGRRGQTLVADLHSLLGRCPDYPGKPNG